jgi:cell division protein FtsQ
MHQSRSKKIILYFFLFIIIGTLNNKNIDKIDLMKINTINVTGLSENKNNELIYNLNFLKIGNIFFLKKNEIIQILNSYNLVEEYTVFKKYPSTLDIQIKKTKFLAQLKKKDGNFLLGSNGKLIKTIEFKEEIPFIFGDFENEQFFSLKEAIDQTNFEFSQIKNLFIFKSGRWDIETKNGLIIKLPKDKVYLSLNILINFLQQNSEKKIKEIDLRQDNQIIING